MRPNRPMTTLTILVRIYECGATRGYFSWDFAWISLAASFRESGRNHRGIREHETERVRRRGDATAQGERAIREEGCGTEFCE